MPDSLNAPARWPKSAAPSRPNGLCLAPTTVAVLWDGAQWRWAQWTGVDWIALPWRALAPQPAAARDVGPAYDAEPLKTSEPRCFVTPPSATIGVRSTRRDVDWPGPLTMLAGHVMAAVMGLALGYYVLCCVRPAEFNRWDLPVPAWNATITE